MDDANDATHEETFRMNRTGRFLLLTALLIIVTTGLAYAESAEMIEERRALDVVKAVQSGDADALLARMHENWIPAEDSKDREARWSKFVTVITSQERGNEIAGVKATEPHVLTIVTERPSGDVISFIFEFESELPYRVIGMGVEADRGDGGSGNDLPPFELPSGADKQAIFDALTNWFSRLADDDVFSGTALVAWQGKPLFSGAWGLASQEWNVPNRIDTRFDLGSINKSFTRIAIGQLAAQGKLSFDDHIADHLPDYPNEEVASKVTIRHLLDHSSGLGDIFTEEFFNSSKALYREPRDFFPLFADKSLLFEPGERSEYSNAGFMVLGAIIEAVSGQPYDEYVIDEIFAPAGMTNAGFFAHDEIVPNVAVGYTRMGPEGWGETRRNNLLMLPVKGNSAGSAQATVEDLLNFDDALREYRLLSPAYTMWYLGGAEPSQTSESDKTKPRATAGSGIAGGAPGVSAVLESDADLAVVVLSNYDASITESIARQLFRPLRRVLRNAGE
jgi:CubicO group peptidase (beta-lactamase class C family)